MKQFIKEVYQIWITERPIQLAAALAYYSMFSFAPIIFVAVSIIDFFLEELDPASQLIQRLESVLGPAVSEFVQQSVAALAQAPEASSLLISLISFLALVYAASGLFYQLQYSLNTIWRVPLPEKTRSFGFIRKRLFSFLIVIGFGLLGILATFANLLLGWFGSIMEKLLGIGGNQVLAARIAAPIILLLIISLFFKILPETKIAWRDVWLGATITTVLILIAIFLAGIFFQYSAINSALQATGAFTILLASFYYVAQIFLLGVVSCRVYANLYGSRRVLEK